jgi:hypothetical protein
MALLDRSSHAVENIEHPTFNLNLESADGADWRRLLSANKQVGERNGLFLAGEATARWFSSKNSFICGICEISG